MIINEFDDLANDYDEILKSQMKNFGGDSSYFAEYKARLIKKYLTTNDKCILEFGCGTGKNLPFLQKTFPDSQIFGYDVSKDSLEIAEKNVHNVKLINNLSDFTTKADIILIANVYHHIPIEQREKVTNTIWNILKTNGEIFIIEHNLLNPVTKNTMQKCPIDKNAIFLNPKETKNLFSAYKHKSELKYCTFIPPSIKGLAFIEPYITWLPLGGQYLIKIKKL